MAISPRFALVPPAGGETARSPVACVYSFDLDGNLIEMNSTLAGILGYSRDDAAQLNLGQVLEPDSQKTLRDEILMQLGGSGPRPLSVTAVTRDGTPVRLAVVRRLLFERGRPVAIQDSGRVLAERPETGAAIIDLSAPPASEWPRFAEQLK